MKKNVVILAIAAIVLTFALSSCNPVEKKIIGTWVYESTVAGVKTETKYIFRDNGEGAVTTIADIEVPFTYSISDGQITLTGSVLGLSNSTAYAVSIKGDTMTLTRDGDTMTLTRAK